MAGVFVFQKTGKQNLEIAAVVPTATQLLQRKEMNLDRAAVKTVGEWALEVLGVPFGGPNFGRDVHDEFFDKNTNVYANVYETIPAVKYHGGYDTRPVVVGRAKYLREDAKGHWYRVELDPKKTESSELMQAAKEGQLFGSSGSVGHLVRKIAENKIVDQLGRIISKVVGGFREGQILEWPSAELSLLDMRRGQVPANSYAVALPALKSVYDQAGLSLPENLESLEPDAEAAEAYGGKPAFKRSADGDRKKTKPKGAWKMDEQTIELTPAQLLAREEAAAKRERERIETEIAAKAARVKEIADAEAAAVKTAELKWKEENKEALEAAEVKKKADDDAAIKAKRLNDGEAPNLAKFGNTWQFDNLDTGALAFAVGALEAAKSGGRSRGGAGEDAMKALAIRMVEEKDEKRVNVRTKMAMKAANMPLKADEINQSTLANFGDEWIGVGFSTELWMRIVQESEIVGKIPAIEVPRGVEAVNIPLQGTPPIFYKVAQVADLESGSLSRPEVTVPASKMGTGKRNLGVVKMGARSIYAGELEIQSFIPWAEELRNSTVQEGQETLEHVVIDGDTEVGATTNINDIGGTPVGNEAFQLVDGFRKLALVTNTTNSRDAGAFAAVDFLETVKLMGLGGRNALKKDGVEFIIDAWTHWASLNLPEVKTRDVFVAPTLESGTLTGIWGYKVRATGNMHRANQDATYGLKANAAGKIDLDTASNNTKGAILSVRYDQWRVGFQRRMTMEVTRYPESDASQIVALMMFGLINRDAEASAISYNVTV